MDEEKIRELFDKYSEKIAKNQFNDYQLDQSLKRFHDYFLNELSEAKLYPAKDLLHEWCSFLDIITNEVNEENYSKDILIKSHSQARNLYHFFETTERDMKKNIVLEPYKLFLDQKDKPYYLRNALLFFPNEGLIKTILVRAEEDEWNYYNKDEKNKLSELIELSENFLGEMFYVNSPENYPLEQTVKPLAINKYILAASSY